MRMVGESCPEADLSNGLGHVAEIRARCFESQGTDVVAEGTAECLAKRLREMHGVYSTYGRHICECEGAPVMRMKELSHVRQPSFSISSRTSRPIPQHPEKTGVHQFFPNGKMSCSMMGDELPHATNQGLHPWRVRATHLRSE
jgi:hypothetical protein